MAKRKITIEFDDGEDYSSPFQSPQIGEYGRHWPAETVPWRGENPCTHCMNNPINNPQASGVCHCVLPYMWQTIY